MRFYGVSIVTLPFRMGVNVVVEVVPGTLEYLKAAGSLSCPVYKLIT